MEEDNIINCFVGINEESIKIILSIFDYEKTCLVSLKENIDSIEIRIHNLKIIV